MPKKRIIRKKRRMVGKAPKCFFCVEKKIPDYKDYEILSNFVSGRARILPTEKSGICSKHQRIFSREIKRARHLSLLPFVEKVK